MFYLQKGRTSWIRNPDEPDVDLYGGGRKGVKRYASFLYMFGLQFYIYIYIEQRNYF